MNETATRGIPVPVIFGVAAMLAVAALPLPYGYYQLLRLVATGVFAWATLIAFQRGYTGHGFGFMVLTLLFNPVLPVYLSKVLWVPIDLGAALGLVLSKAAIANLPGVIRSE